MAARAVLDPLLALPIVTQTVLGLNIVIFIATFVFPRDLAASDFCLIPALITYSPLSNFYRFFLSPFWHFTVLHILFNTLSFAPIGAWFELIHGSAETAYDLFLFGVLSNVVLFVISYVVRWADWQLGVLLTCTAGYSSVIFAVLTIQSNMSNAPTSYANSTRPDEGAEEREGN